jgi:hypothetical protein
MSCLPGLFREVSLVVCHPHSGYEADIERLIGQINNFRADMLQCRTRVNSVFLDALKSSTECDLVYELLATCLVASAMANRLLIAIGSSDGNVLERETLVDAAGVMKLEGDMISTGGWASLYLNQKASIAAAIATSMGIWENEPGHVIEKWRFHEWCRAMQRDCCCYVF